MNNANTAIADQSENATDSPSDSTVEGLKNKLGRYADFARQQAGRADDLVRANPYAAIGIAAATGALVGYLVARSCNGKK
jgi:ElaB/YqjD/DUF883 family membrane-anchored ribosome-binding protein